MPSQNTQVISRQDLKQSLKSVCRSDFYRLNAKLNKADTEQLSSLSREIEKAIKRRSLRNINVPNVVCNEALPIFTKKDEFQSVLQQNQVIIVCGETGSGKTTQLPLYCLETGRGIDGLIGHTQPRRIAARTVAKRIADELQTNLGEKVGFKIRHQDHTDDQTYIKLMTDGVLLNEMQQDRYLNQYDTIIIDEAHERSLNIDFILGYIKQLLPKRPDLKVIVTSATIDVKRFSTYFNDAPIIEVSGKTYPVDVIYHPINEEEHDARLNAILDAIRELSSFDMGDILIFLEGEGEIHETDKFLRKQRLADTDILPLYARLSSSRQGKIFSPHKRRHIVLATNVAETSLTIPGIRYVIDTGQARISRYSVKSKVQRLPIERISRAAANQRKGRCGRTSDGICIRLYSEEDFNSRTEFTQPEILRTNLASVILQMKLLNLGDIKEYPFLEPPEAKQINDGINLLKEINALDHKDKLTKAGRKIARMPIEPRYARMLLAANEYQCVSEMLVIVSALSIQDPRERPLDSPNKADKAHAQFQDEDSDFFWFINLWHFYHEQMKKLSQNKLKKMCVTNYLSYIRMREWLDIHRQLRHISTELKLTLNKEPANYQSIHFAILSGLASHVAFHSEKHSYSGARNTQSYLFPASTLFDKKPKWIVAAELVETSRLYARNIAKIESQWVIKTAKHLLKYQYTDIHWESESGRVVAKESTLLYGMVLRANRIINYGKVNSTEARKIFIQHALVDNQFNNNTAIIIHNKKLIDEIRSMEIKTRRPDILDEAAIYQFYDAALPDDVYDAHTFERWAAQQDSAILEKLKLDKSVACIEGSELLDHDAFPDNLVVNKIKLPLNYQFEPGVKSDGLTVEVPLETLGQFKDEQFDYLVPGLLKEKIVYLLKSLPKSIRKQLVPIPDVADECFNNIKTRNAGLHENLEAYLFRSRGISINKQDWAYRNLPEHLTVQYRILDKEGKVVSEGDSLEILRDQLAVQSNDALIEATHNETTTIPVDKWDFGDLPVSESIQSVKAEITVYPALKAIDGLIYRHAYESLASAEYHFKAGLLELYKKQVKQELKYLKKSIRDIDHLLLQYGSIGSKDDFFESFVNQVVIETFLFEKKAIRKQEEFHAKLEQGKQNLLINSEKLSILINQILGKFHKVCADLDKIASNHNEITITDIHQQLSYLIYNGFIEDVSMQELKHYPRYLDAINRRLEKLAFSVEKEQKNVKLISEHWHRIMQLVDNAYETGDYPEILNEYRWLMEEWRVSLFAQDLKTMTPVSLKRMNQKWENLQAFNR